MSSAIVTFPDDEFATQVNAMQDSLSQIDGVTPESTPPHLSLHSATKYDASLSNTMHVIADELAPFEVTTSGIGIFTSTEIVYIPVARSKQLANLREAAWKVGSPSATDESPYYSDQQWIPHVTLVKSFEDRQLPEIINRVQEVSPTFTVEEVGLIRHRSDDSVDVQRVSL